jgi:putative membrane protein
MMSSEDAMSPDRRLHPLTVLFDAGRWLPQFLLPLVVLVFAAQQNQRAALVVFASTAPIIGVVFIVSVVRYLRFSYRYDAGELVIRSGFFTRNERSIPYVRIQNLDAVQNPVHRLLGVSVVHIQTGGGAEPEATLRVIPVAALHEMRARVMAAGGRADARASLDPGTPADATAAPDPAVPGVGTSLVAEAPAHDALAIRIPAQPRTLLSLAPRDLILAGFIENRGMVLIVGALAVLEQTGAITRFTERLFRGENTASAARWLGGAELPAVRGALYVTAGLLVALLFIRLLSTVWAVVRLYDFRLTRLGDELHTEYGLFTRVSATIPLRRVQTVIVRDGVLHRLFGRHAVMVETAGGVVTETGARPREPIAPILRLTELPTLLEELHPGLELSAVQWQPVHRRAFGRMLRGSLLIPIALSLGAFLLVQIWAVAVFAVLLAGVLVHARLRFRHLAWSLTRDAIAVRDGALTRATRIARFSRVQVVAVDQNPVDLRTGMARVRADTAGAGSGVVIPYLPEQTAIAVQAELSARMRETAFSW